MRLDIYRDILLKISKELEIDAEYRLDSGELEDRFNITTKEKLREVYFSLYSRNKLYSFEDEITLEEPFLIRMNSEDNTLIFSLNPVWKRRFFFKGKNISESLREIWALLTEETPDKDCNDIFNLGSEEDTAVFQLRDKLKKLAKEKGGYNQMTLIGLIDRADDIGKLYELGRKYKLSKERSVVSREIDIDSISIDEYKSELRKKVNDYPSYKRMSLLGYINRAQTKEELSKIFTDANIDGDTLKKMEESFHHKKEPVKRPEAVMDEEQTELDLLKSETRKKVMKMSTFNKMTILGFISSAKSKDEIISLIDKFKIK